MVLCVHRSKSMSRRRIRGVGPSQTPFLAPEHQYVKERRKSKDFRKAPFT